MKRILLGVGAAAALVALTAFALHSKEATTAGHVVIPGPVRLADLPLQRAFHQAMPATFLAVGIGYGFQTTLPASSGAIAVTEIGLTGLAGQPSGNGAAATISVEVNGVLVAARTAGGAWGVNGGFVQLTDSFKFDPPIVVAAGQTVRIHGAPDQLSFTLSIAGWELQPGEL